MDQHVSDLMGSHLGQRLLSAEQVADYLGVPVKRCTSGGTREWVREGSGLVAISGIARRRWRRGSTSSAPGSVARLLDASYDLMAVGWQAAGRAGRAG